MEFVLKNPCQQLYIFQSLPPNGAFPKRPKLFPTVFCLSTLLGSLPPSEALPKLFPVALVQQSSPEASLQGVLSVHASRSPHGEAN